MGKKILGLDLGSNSIGWALLHEENGQPDGIIGAGVRIFIKAVEEKTPTPKNAKRRNARLTRRVLQRRARRKQRLLNYLVKLELLPKELQGHPAPEIILNTLGDPYLLRAKALDHAITAHELGRVLLHLVQRRGFLSNRKTLLGDMVDDPDVLETLAELEQEESGDSEQAKEETAFKHDIQALRQEIAEAGCRTLGEYLASLGAHDCKRNRKHEGGHLRTDRQMYREELALIWQRQMAAHPVLLATVADGGHSVMDEIESIIFKQRPLKLQSDRVGRCSLEPTRQRARIARLECQRFRYWQDINNLHYFDPYREQSLPLNNEDKQKLAALFERQATVSFAQIRKALGFDKSYEFNLENGGKKLKGNTTAREIRAVLDDWDDWAFERQQVLVEDLLTIQKKSVLKNRLLQYWQMPVATAVKLCLLEFEPGHANLSLKAINKLLPFLQQGQMYSEARVSAGYGYEKQAVQAVDRLGKPPEIPNPIVQKALHELRRVINALMAEHGKPDAIRIEMARDLEMNTQRYQAFIKQQKANTKANEEAEKKYQEAAQLNPHLQLSKYASRDDKIRHRLWEDQSHCCAYSGRHIDLATLFSAEIEIDHILPYSESLDDSYMNKVVCYTAENRIKGQRTPMDAFGGDPDKWNQITQRLQRWDKKLKSKKDRFFMRAADVQQRDFIESQLNDTRYICRVAHQYLQQLGADVSVSKGVTTAWLRHQWDLNSLVGERNEKERNDHRHHSIDAAVIACVDRRFYRILVGVAKDMERRGGGWRMRDLHIDPPWPSLREDLQAKLAGMVVAHTPQLKLSGALHEETGVGFIENLGCVYRANLDGDFDAKHAKKIIDPSVRALVETHLAQHGDNPKQAFAPGFKLYHKDGATPIKRVRVLQSKTTRQKLEAGKFGVKDRQGKVFKYLAYGNLHHVEILRDRESGEFSGKFVTMMEAHRRAKGIGESKQPLIQTDHGKRHEFVMALHINDLVSVEKDGKRVFYRVQVLDSANKRISLRLHTAATLKSVNETLLDRDSTIPALMRAGLQKHRVNAAGKIIP